MQLAVFMQEVLTQLFKGDPSRAVEILRSAAVAAKPEVLSLLRVAAQRPRQPLLYYLKLHNLWLRLGRPPLKPNPVKREVLLLADATSDNLIGPLQLFCATYGVTAAVETSPYDSVEQLVLDPGSALRCSSEQIVVLYLSEQWLARYFGNRCLVPLNSLDRVKDTLRQLVDGLLARGPGRVLILNFPGRAYPLPSGTAMADGALGWNRAVTHLNDCLGAQCGSRVHLVDLTEAIAGAGGRSALGRLTYFRSKMALEAAGTVAAAREIASALADVCGKTHRAVLTDWDNTLWGGEVAEVGSHGVVCGLDSPDALAYHRVQGYLKDLKSIGVLLGGASRNDPGVQKVFEENADLPLRLDDFASLHVGFHPKSESAAAFARNVGFGPEFVVFLDDSLFELTEVLAAHPAIDILLAGPDAETTLGALSDARFFNAIALSADDLQRGEAAARLAKQRDAQAGYANAEDFLKAIDIKLVVAGLNDKNLPRAVQLLQKSNQFNLTTRRHQEHDLKRLVADGAKIGVFSYEDSFGPQGVIAVVILAPDAAGMRIDSWVMSCRVLNRTVEEAVFAWVAGEAGPREVLGEYIPTEKNGLVRDLYRRLGFELLTHEHHSGRQLWRWAPVAGLELPRHFIELRKAA
jgi:FkbH-like protein